jgi:DNA-binding CsgD family transcriptional regulator
MARKSHGWSQASVVQYESALTSVGRRRRLMAQALATATAGVSASRAWMWSVDGNGIPVADDIVLLTHGRQPRTPERAADEYRQHYWRDDPFAPHRFLDRRRRVVTVEDVGGVDALRRTAYGREFLPESGFAHRVFVHLWDDGRLNGIIALLRQPHEQPFAAGEATFLHRMQPLVSMAYAHAGRPATRLQRQAQLAASGLRPRQIEVAGLAAGGATNAEIAQALLISPLTVKRHLSIVYSRLGIRSRTELSVLLQPEG